MELAISQHETQGQASATRLQFEKRLDQLHDSTYEDLIFKFLYNDGSMASDEAQYSDEQLTQCFLKALREKVGIISQDAQNQAVKYLIQLRTSLLGQGTAQGVIPAGVNDPHIPLQEQPKGSTPQTQQPAMDDRSDSVKIRLFPQYSVNSAPDLQDSMQQQQVSDCGIDIVNDCGQGAVAREESVQEAKLMQTNECITCLKQDSNNQWRSSQLNPDKRSCSSACESTAQHSPSSLRAANQNNLTNTRDQTNTIQQQCQDTMLAGLQELRKLIEQVRTERQQDVGDILDIDDTLGSLQLQSDQIQHIIPQNLKQSGNINNIKSDNGAKSRVPDTDIHSERGQHQDSNQADKKQDFVPFNQFKTHQSIKFKDNSLFKVGLDGQSILPADQTSGFDVAYQNNYSSSTSKLQTNDTLKGHLNDQIDNFGVIKLPGEAKLQYQVLPQQPLEAIGLSGVKESCTRQEQLDLQVQQKNLAGQNALFQSNEYPLRRLTNDVNQQQCQPNDQHNYSKTFVPLLPSQNGAPIFSDKQNETIKLRTNDLHIQSGFSKPGTSDNKTKPGTHARRNQSSSTPQKQSNLDAPQISTSPNISHKNTKFSTTQAYNDLEQQLLQELNAPMQSLPAHLQTMVDNACLQSEQVWRVNDSTEAIVNKKENQDRRVEAKVGFMLPDIDALNDWVHSLNKMSLKPPMTNQDSLYETYQRIDWNQAAKGGDNWKQFVLQYSKLQTYMQDKMDKNAWDQLQSQIFAKLDNYNKYTAQQNINKKQKQLSSRIEEQGDMLSQQQHYVAGTLKGTPQYSNKDPPYDSHYKKRHLSKSKPKIAFGRRVGDEIVSPPAVIKSKPLPSKSHKQPYIHQSHSSPLQNRVNLVQPWPITKSNASPISRSPVKKQPQSIVWPPFSGQKPIQGGNATQVVGQYWPYVTQVVPQMNQPHTMHPQERPINNRPFNQQHVTNTRPQQEISLFPIAQQSQIESGDGLMVGSSRHSASSQDRQQQQQLIASHSSKYSQNRKFEETKDISVNGQIPLESCNKSNNSKDDQDKQCIQQASSASVVKASNSPKIDDQQNTYDDEYSDKENIDINEGNTFSQQRVSQPVMLGVSSPVLKDKTNFNNYRPVVGALKIGQRPLAQLNPVYSQQKQKNSTDAIKNVNRFRSSQIETRGSKCGSECSQAADQHNENMEESASSLRNATNKMNKQSGGVNEALEQPPIQRYQLTTSEVTSSMLRQLPGMDKIFSSPDSSTGSSLVDPHFKPRASIGGYQKALDMARECRRVENMMNKLYNRKQSSISSDSDQSDCVLNNDMYTKFRSNGNKQETRSTAADINDQITHDNNETVYVNDGDDPQPQQLPIELINSAVNDQRVNDTALQQTQTSSTRPPYSAQWQLQPGSPVQPYVHKKRQLSVLQLGMGPRALDDASVQHTINLTDTSRPLWRSNTQTSTGVVHGTLDEQLATDHLYYSKQSMKLTQKYQQTGITGVEYIQEQNGANMSAGSAKINSSIDETRQYATKHASDTEQAGTNSTDQQEVTTTYSKDYTQGGNLQKDQGNIAGIRTMAGYDEQQVSDYTSSSSAASSTTLTSSMTLSSRLDMDQYMSDQGTQWWTTQDTVHTSKPYHSTNQQQPNGQPFDTLPGAFSQLRSSMVPSSNGSTSSIGDTTTITTSTESTTNFNVKVEVLKALRNRRIERPSMGNTIS